MMVQKGLYYDPTIIRYVEPYMDDNDAKLTGGKYRIIPIFEKAATMAAATSGIKVMMGSGVDGSTYAHGTQALDFEALVKRAHMTPLRAIQAGTTNVLAVQILKVCYYGGVSNNTLCTSDADCTGGGH